MVSVRKMQRGDAKHASKMTKEIMLDCWRKYEKDYYPKKALDFDISVHSPNTAATRLNLKRTSLLLPKKTMKLLE